MKNKGGNRERDELRPEYDFSKMPGGVRGKYVDRCRRGTNLILLERDVASAFPDGRAIDNCSAETIVVLSVRTTLDAG